MKSQLNFYRNKIQSTLSRIDTILYESGVVNKSLTKSLVDLVEAFTVLSNVSGDENLILESAAYEKRINCYTVIPHGNLNEGFVNPFSEYDESAASYVNAYQEDLYRDKNPNYSNDDIKISKVRLWNGDTDNKIMFKDGKMVAGQYFGKGDIIEKCPIRLLFEKDMYSENIRKFAFVLDKQKGIYAVPFGYASFYRNSKDSGIEGNCDYEYVIGNTPEASYIKIFALKPIRKGAEMILHSEETDFENEIKPGQFKYDNDGEYVSTKSFKIL